MCCNLFQTKKSGAAFRKIGDCPNDVPAAKGNRATMTVEMHNIETEKT
jgi:hypothetical protein